MYFCFLFAAIACPADSPRHGYVVNVGNLYPIDSTINFKCKRGYMIEGKSSLKCILIDGEYGDWDDDIPKCVGM